MQPHRGESHHLRVGKGCARSISKEEEGEKLIERKGFPNCFILLFVYIKRTELI